LAVFIAIVLSLIPHDMQYGPQAALIAESFTPRLRYSGASLGYQLASIIAGGPAPIIATALFAACHTGYAIGRTFRALIVTFLQCFSAGWSRGSDTISRGLIQNLRDKSINVTVYKPDTDKRARVIAQSDLFAGGSVRFPQRAAWLEEFTSELLAFPGRHDDQVDALTQGLA
jgi:terminase large subunit-like protein